MDEMRRQLDALMGTDRNERVGTVKHFTDDDVCRFYLCGICPYDLFTNTKKNMGPCPKLHSEPLRIQYDLERTKKDYGFEREVCRRLDDIVRDCDREIERQQRKLKDSEDEKMNDPVERQIKELRIQADQLGEEGKIDEYNQVMEQIEALKTKKSEPVVAPVLDGALGQVLSQGKSQQQKLRVCEICACLLSKQDSENNRVADHFSGKLHTGYKEVREKHDELLRHGFGPDSKGPDREERSGGPRRREHGFREEPYRSRDYDRRDNRDYDRNRRDFDRRDNRDYDRRDRDYDRRDRGDRDRRYR